MTKLHATTLLACMFLTTCVTEYTYNWYGPVPDEGVTTDVTDKDMSGGDVVIDVGTETICTPQCDGRQCGPDMCGGDCWTYHYCPDTSDCLPACDDGNPCTGTETCNVKDGVCEQGEAVIIDDEIDCTSDSCDEETGQPVHEPDDTVCDNDKACDGLETCDPLQGCLPGDAPEIDDNVECTIDECDDQTGTVTHTPDNTACNDDKVCTTDSCDKSDGCVFTALDDGEAPDGECADGNPCTQNLCTAGECDNPLFPWDELLDEIAQGQCICEDIDACADLEDGDLCNGTLDCLPIPDDPTPDDPDDFKACQTAPGSIWADDGLYCNGLETCDPETGAQSPGTPPQVDDAFDCTTDSCDEENDVVVHDPVHALCDDGSVCTNDVCTKEDGCTYSEANPGAECIPEDPCTTDAACDKGQCKGTPRIDLALADGGCLGDNPCLTYGCTPDGGTFLCTQEANPQGMCTDDNECTVDDACIDGACIPGEPVDCNDNFDCTTESCIPETGQCTYSHNDAACDDSVPCTTDTCDGQGADGCLHETDDALCDDANPCTDDVCDPISDCIHTPNNAQCNDGDDCTLSDTCSNGECTGTPDLVNCADWDHDRVLGGADLCPYAFDPQQLDLDENLQPDACEQLDIIDLYTRPITLSQSGAPSQWRRTHEPFELPLTNGIVDDSVIGYWKLDDGQAVDYSGNGHHGTVIGATAGDGAFGDGDGGMVGDGSGYVDTEFALDMSTEDSFTLMAWFRVDSLGVLQTIVGADTGAVSPNRSQIWFGVNMVGQLTGGMRLKENKDWHEDVQVGAPVEPGKWYHGAWTYNSGSMAIYLDGSLADTAELLHKGTLQNPTTLCIGATSDLQAQEQFYGYLAGNIDEAIIFNRALTPDEIETYYRSSAPYGTRFAPGAQADFDDIRVTETSGPGDPEDTGTTVKRSRILGPRPHSDTACPATYDGVPVEDIPGIESRDDLCGVAAYWRLDGDATDVLGVHDGEIHGATPARGRFGDSAGSMQFDGDDFVLMPESEAYSFDPVQDDFTVELWVHPDGEGDPGQTILADRGEGNSPIAFRLTYNYNYKTFNLSSHDGVVGLDCATLGVFPAGSWYHVSMVFSQGQRNLYVNGQIACQGEYAAGAIAQARSLTMGRICTPECSSYFRGAIDEVIIHNVAKSADYIYHRSSPGVPKVRFLVNSEVENGGTEELPAYPMRDYMLHWGDGDAGMRPVCVGRCRWRRMLGIAQWVSRIRGLVAV